MEIEYKIAKPEAVLSDFVERFYMVTNHAAFDKEMVVIPDGRIDLFFLQSENKPFTAILLGLETIPSSTFFWSNACFFGISFKLLAVEYILNQSIADFLNGAKLMPTDFLEIKPEDLLHFEALCHKASEKIKNLIQPKIDTRKQKLFELLYATNGSLTINEYAEKVYWSNRQINRYFNQTFGISLKTYCNILRFRASFQQIKDGNLYPEQNFSDQPHFVREVKKLAGVVPKELSKNKNDRFVQFSSLLKQ